MPAKAKVDHIETLELDEQWGVVTGVVRKAIVIDIPPADDWTVMLSVLNADGMPVRNTFLNELPHLKLADRKVKMTGKATAEVTLMYGMFNDKGQLLEYFGEFGNGQWGNNAVAGKMSVSVAQKKTNFYRPDGVGPEQDIILRHTYPPDDPDYANKTVEQTGQVDVFIPQRTFTLQGAKYTGSPWLIANDCIGNINGFFWMGQPEHTWMCTEVTWEYRQLPSFFMTFTFQHNPDKWNPTAVFVDDRSKKPPPGLVPGEGIEYIRYHRPVNFEFMLGFAIAGSS